MIPFYNQLISKRENFGSFVMVICGTILSFILGSTLSVGIAQSLNVDFNNQEGINSSFVLVFNLIPFIFPFLFLVLMSKVVHKVNPLVLFTSRKKIDWKRFFIMFGIWFGLNMLLLLFEFSMGSDLVGNFNIYKFSVLLLVAILLVPIQTTAEELFFRSYLFQFFGKYKVAPIVAILLISSLFAWMHGSNPEVVELGGIILVYYGLNGLFLGLISHLDDGIELSMGFHAANNLFGCLIVSYESSVLRTDSLFKLPNADFNFWISAGYFIVVTTLIFFFLKKKYNWKLNRLFIVEDSAPSSSIEL